MEVQMNAVQRIMEFIEENPREKDFDIPEPPEDWPRNVKTTRMKSRTLPTLLSSFFRERSK